MPYDKYIRLSKDQEAEIIKQYLCQIKTKNIAAAFGINTHRVRDILLRHKIPLRARTVSAKPQNKVKKRIVCKKFVFTNEQLNEINDRYQSGERLADLAPLYGCKTSKLRKDLKNFGATVKQAKTPVQIVSLEKVCDILKSNSDYWKMGITRYSWDTSVALYGGIDQIKWNMLTTRITKESLQADRAAKLSYDEIQKKYGITQYMVFKLLTHYQLSTKLSSLYQELNDEQIITMYRDGNSMRDIAKKIGCYPNTRHIVIRLNELIPNEIRHETGISTGEKEVLAFVKSKIPGVDIIENDKSIIFPQELDIVIPSKKLAIEFNGCYWHSDSHKKFNYHIEKTKACNEIGFRVIHICESDWLHRRDVVESMLSNALGLTEHNLGANKCIIKEISEPIAASFLQENHLRKSVPGKYRLGLFRKDTGELMSVATFGGSRFSGVEDEWELLRFASKKNTNVQGAFQKIIAFFRAKQRCKSLLSYADLAYGTGRVYEKAGFTKTGVTIPGFYYINAQTLERKSRHALQKWKLLKADSTLDPSKTGDILAKQLGYFKIYDCGHAIYWLNLEPANTIHKTS
jgi:hypothetical protein